MITKVKWPQAFEDANEKSTTTWLTPPGLVRALGKFNLDPCEAVNQPWRLARHGFNIVDDGLAQRWRGRVFCNPPYETKVLDGFVRKMIEHDNGILLVFARVERKWFVPIWQNADAFLFLHGRLSFYTIDGKMSAGNVGASVLCAFGQDNVAALRHSGLAGAFIDSFVWMGGANMQEVSAWT